MSVPQLAPLGETVWTAADPTGWWFHSSAGGRLARCRRPKDAAAQVCGLLSACAALAVVPHPPE
ncbi:hypothetical protein [Actinomadura parmotrematis]|uniref:Uncharacterized protein n=1 Tax=Actinomadura parmotrematis TaxID=2864039 RepID=A0ABS7FPJ4_9ACTN|nr:hypothetical protein [Actinomadura parmotrematis]MBW8482140.1 hypothetical protein [Actinomadura parmotrematis]